MMFEPRRKTGAVRWVHLPTEFLSQVQLSLKEQFGGKSRSWSARGALFPDELCLRAGYAEGNSLRPFNFEVSVDREGPANAQAELNQGLDLLGALFEKHFASDPTGESESTLPPLTWTAIKFDGRQLFFRHSSVNDDLEAQANALLGEEDHTDKFVQGDWDTEETEH